MENYSSQIIINKESKQSIERKYIFLGLSLENRTIVGNIN